MSVKIFVPFRGDGPDRYTTGASTLIDIRNSDGKLVKQVIPATAKRIIEAGGKPLYDSRRRLVRVTVDLNQAGHDASRTTVSNRPATSGLCPVRLSKPTRNGRLAAGGQTDRNVQSNVAFHGRSELWNIPLPRSDKQWG